MDEATALHKEAKKIASELLPEVMGHPTTKPSNVVMAIMRHNHGLVLSSDSSERYLWVKDQKSNNIKQRRADAVFASMSVSTNPY